jgi:serine/threonine protein kinase
MTLHGTILGKYQIVDRLGEGGMGTVYHARDEMLDRDVAIKVLRPELARQASLVERFRAEAIALARLTHPNIAALYGMERDGGQLLMIMEFVQGETLESRLHRTGGLPWRRALEVCVDVCQALDHAHDQGVVHRDIKPANLMITPRGSVKVMDFGIARVIGRNRQTQLGRSVGTPMYMAPEQLRGEEVDGRTDVYALGAVLYESITGQVAFDADSDYSLMQKQLHDAPPTPGLRVAGIPAAVDAIVTRTMAKRPEDRFPSASALRAEAQRALRETPQLESASAAHTPETRLSIDTPPPRPKPVLEDTTPTRDPSAPGETRVAADERPAGETRIVAEQRGARPSRFVNDWRIWGGVAALLVFATVAMRSVKSAARSLPAAAAPAAAKQTSTPEKPSPTGPTLQAAPSSPPAVVGAGQAPPAAPVAQDPRLLGAHPLVESDRETPRREAGGNDVKPRPAPAQPAQTGKTREAAPPPDTRAPSPAVRQPVAETPAPEPKPSENAEAIASAARSAASSWIASIGTADASAIGSVLDGSTKVQSDLLALIKDHRLGIASQDSPQVEVNGASATAGVSTSLAYRSPFGASRRAAVQFALELARDGATWRVTKARIVGNPRLD